MIRIRFDGCDLSPTRAPRLQEPSEHRRTCGLLRMRLAHGRAILVHMPLWVLVIVICATVWVIGTVLVVLGATWLVRHEPH